MIQLSITFPHHEKLPPTFLSKKLFFETLRSGEKYRSSCTRVFYENKCSEKLSGKFTHSTFKGRLFCRARG